jgi:hypothetical protein
MKELDGNKRFLQEIIKEILQVESMLYQTAI